MKLQLARNAFANLLGALVPALVALGTVPLVVRGLGEAGYGVYSLVTAIVGYFAVIDMNVTAGSVKFIAGFSARKDSAKVNETICFGIMVYALLGVVGALGLFGGAHSSSPACSACRPRWRPRRSPPAGWRRSDSSSASCRTTCKACRRR